MIIDNIENAEYYYGLGEKFKKGFEFLKKNDLSKFENGKYEIDGQNLFVSIQDYNSKPENEGKFEAHKKYADIQFIIKGTEKLGYGNVKNFKATTNYDAENDIVFLEGHGQFAQAKENTFLIFMPQDAHMPCIAVENPTYVKKAVVKVKI